MSNSIRHRKGLQNPEDVVPLPKNPSVDPEDVVIIQVVENLLTMVVARKVAAENSKDSEDVDVITISDDEAVVSFPKTVQDYEEIIWQGEEGSDDDEMTSDGLEDSEIIQNIINGPKTEVEVVVKGSDDVTSSGADSDSEVVVKKSPNKRHFLSSESDSDDSHVVVPQKPLNPSSAPEDDVTIFTKLAKRHQVLESSSEDSDAEEAQSSRLQKKKKLVVKKRLLEMTISDSDSEDNLTSSRKIQKSRSSSDDSSDSEKGKSPGSSSSSDSDDDSGKSPLKILTDSVTASKRAQKSRSSSDDSSDSEDKVTTFKKLQKSRSSSEDTSGSEDNLPSSKKTQKSRSSSDDSSDSENSVTSSRRFQKIPISSDSDDDSGENPLKTPAALEPKQTVAGPKFKSSSDDSSDSEDNLTSSRRNQKSSKRSSSSDSDDDSEKNPSTIPAELLRIFSAPPFPPQMAMYRDTNSYDYCVFMCDYMNEYLTEKQKDHLKHNPHFRTSLYRRYAGDGHLIEDNRENHIEDLPIYIFLMAPRTQKVYLDGFKDNKSPTGSSIYKLIFKASLINDDDVAELLEKYVTEEIKLPELKMCLAAIKDGKDWRVVSIGVSRVKTLNVVPDGAFLACFKEIPDFPLIQSKSINCVVIAPSPKSLLHLSELNRTVSASINGCAIGRQGSYTFHSFGTRLAHNGAGKYSTLQSMFKFLFNNRRELNQKIYVVEGFF